MGMFDVEAAVRPWLKVGAAETDVTASLVALGGSILLVGTRSGCLMVFRLSASSAPGKPASQLIFTQRLHCGALYDIAISSSHLVATVGYDAACCVVPLADLLTRAAVGTTGPMDGDGLMIRRLSGHSLPVISAAFFRDGLTLATLSIHGELIVFDTVAAVPRWRVRCGFPARALALSADDTYCFVAGAKLARVDLFSAFRKASSDGATLAPYSARTSAVEECPQPWLQLCSWCETAADDVRADNSRQRGWDSRTYETSDGYLLNRLHVSPEDGSLVALLARRTLDGDRVKEVPVALCRWSFTGLHPFLADSYEGLEASSAVDPPDVFPCDHGRRLMKDRGALLSTEGPAGEEQPPFGGALGTTGALLWASVTARTRAVRRRRSVWSTAVVEQGDAEVDPSASREPTSKARRLEEARARHQALTLECNELARQLREAIAG